MAANAARTLNTHYGNLATSTQRLSSGLRINSAADDAAGLAIRELMRADIAAYNQGIRNANDAISMIQVVDGALGIIDEKLIRMKELAVQAATGTYDSTQRLMIDSEFQAMASEIQRIATATDFNGIKLLEANKEFVLPDGIILNEPIVNIINVTQTDEQRNYHLDPENPDNHATWATLIETTTTQKGTQEVEYYIEDKKLYKNTITDIDIEKNISKAKCAIVNSAGGSGPMGVYSRVRKVQNSKFLDEVIDNSRELSSYTNTYIIDRNTFDTILVDFKYEYVANPEIIDANFANKPHKYSFYFNILGEEVDVIQDVYYDTYHDPDTIKNDFPFFDVSYNKLPPDQYKSKSHSTNETIEEVTLKEFINKVIIHFGPMNDSAEDYYDIEKRDCTLKGLGLENVRIETQDKAQEALVTINDAIVKKDQARAYYGAMQNRLENTVSNLTIQAENLQASESRISDVDVATEMTNFVRNQILTQSAIAMLSQANSMPQMAMQLIG